MNAYSQPVAAAAEPEYNRWYDEVHIPQLLERVPGIVSVRRYRLSDTQLSPPQDRPERAYLTVYDVDTDDLPDFTQRLMTALQDGTLDLSDAIDLDHLGPVMHVYEPTT